MAKKKKQASNMLEVQNAAKTLFANIRFMSPDNPIQIGRASCRDRVFLVGGCGGGGGSV